MSEQDRDDLSQDGNGPGIWISGAVLLAVGVLFLLQNLGVAIPTNWWALALLVPAGFAFVSARRLKAAKEGIYFGSAVTCGVLVALTLLFLFDLDAAWVVVWPLILIAVAIIIFVQAVRYR